MGWLRLNGYGKKIPPQYLRVIASLIPKDIKIDRRLDAGPLSDFTYEELRVLLYAAQNAVAKAENTSALWWWRGTPSDCTRISGRPIATSLLIFLMSLPRH